jgi:hypothetical protein
MRLLPCTNQLDQQVIAPVAEQLIRAAKTRLDESFLTS